MTPLPATIAVCTYRREQVLLDTISQLLAMDLSRAEVLVVDQQAAHSPAVRDQLAAWAREGRIRYLDLDRAGLTHARNVAAREARGDVLIFCDDDVRFAPGWLEEHLAAHGDPSVAAVAGQVLHPGEVPSHDPGSFHHNGPIGDFHGLYGANFSVRRDAFLAVGGADENLGVHAYTEDLILARRLRDAGHRILYQPAASVLHLKDPVGGCRITDPTQPTSEWEKSWSKVYWLHLNPPQTTREALRRWLEAARHGPLRREALRHFWRQPACWWGFAQAVRRARGATRHVRE